MEDENVRDRGGLYPGCLLLSVTVSLFVFCGIAAAVVGDIDMNGDVDWFDMALLTDDWLAAGGISDIDDNNTVDLIDYSLLSGNWLCTNLTTADTPNDLDDTHPRLLMHGYGTENGMWNLVQTDPGYAEIWGRVTSLAVKSNSNGYPLLAAAAAFIVSKNPTYGNICKNVVVANSPGDPKTAVGPAAFALAYDAIVDDPCTAWLTPAQKAAALSSMASIASNTTPIPGDWGLKTTHNYYASYTANHAACTYNLRGESGYESTFATCRAAALEYHNRKVNGLCGAPITNEGPRTSDGFPYEGPQYGTYQVIRGMISRHIIELNEYPNPPTVVDENLSGFYQNYNLAWMSICPPGASNNNWVKVIKTSSKHGILSGVHFASHANWAADNQTMARVGAWFFNELKLAGFTHDDDVPGFELMWYNPDITPLDPTSSGIPLYVHLNDSEFHMYRDTWNIDSPGSNYTYVYFRNSSHHGHTYWAEGHSDGTAGPCSSQTSSHESADNGHFCIWRNGAYVMDYSIPEGDTNKHNCLLIDGNGIVMSGEPPPQDDRGYMHPQFADLDVIGEVDSDYGHALDAIIGPAYNEPGSTVLSDPFSYHRYFFVIRDPMYVLAVDELESGHTVAFRCWANPSASKVSEDVFTNANARYELLYPQSGFTSAATGRPIVFTTGSPQVMFLCHPSRSGVTFSKSYPGGLAEVDVGEDKIIYNPSGLTYSQGDISGNAKLFAERAGGALIFMATEAAGSEYGVSCSAAVNMSVSGNKASIYVYGSGTHTVTVTSPFGPDVFDIEAGQTVFKEL